MRAADRPRPLSSDNKLLVVDPRNQTFRDLRMRDLPEALVPGDLLVVNDAATLPASLFAVAKGGAPIEVRLISRTGGGSDAPRWRAAILGGGDWRTPTEHRPLPIPLAAGDRLDFGPDLSATVTRLFPLSPRLVEIAFDRGGDAFWRALYRHGRPIQYAYLSRDVRLEEVQTAYAARPWAAEMPSAGRPLSWSILLALAGRGVQIRALTHAAGLSSTGDETIDARIPLDEAFEIPEATVRAVEETKAQRRRVIAVGTTVVRALEGAAVAGFRPGRGSTDLKIDGSFVPKIVSGVMTGVHERTASHSALLEAFAPKVLLDRAAAHAEANGYLGHEFGDSWLIA